MASKRYITADGRTWTDDYNLAGMWTPALAAKVASGQTESVCIIPDASGSWLVVNYADPDLAEPVVYIVIIGNANRIGGLYASYDRAVKALEAHILGQEYTYYKSSADTWVARDPNKGGTVVYHVYPYRVQQ